MKKERLYQSLIYSAGAGVALLFCWVLFLSPQILKLPQDFAFEADVQSTDNLFNEITGEFAGDMPSKTKFWYAADGYRNGVLQVWNYFDVRKLNGERIFKVQRLYAIDPLTGRHVKGIDGSNRNGYLFAPRNLDKKDFVYWHINYDAPALMKYRSQEKLSGLIVYRYDCYYTVDQTDSLTYLPGVPKERGVKVDVYLTLWVEPVSGRMVNYNDESSAYFYNKETGEKLNPWNRFSNALTDVSVAYQVELAKYEKYKILVIQRVVPIAVLLIVLLLLWFARCIKKEQQKDSKELLAEYDQRLSPAGGNNLLKFRSLVLPAVIFLLVGMIATGAWRHFQSNLELRIRNKFEVAANNLQGDVVNRLAIYLNVLRSGRGLFAASEDVSRSEWEKFVAAIKLDKNYSGIQGFGFAKYVLNNEKQLMVDTIRQEGFTDFTIFPEGQREVYVPIVYIEPFSGKNLRSFGYDMLSEHVRRQAMEAARDSGRVQLSGKVTLVQETDEEVKQAGVLIYAPIYQKGVMPSSVEERQKTLKGFVFSPFRMNDLMAGILGNNALGVDFVIFDGTESEMNEQTQLFDSGGHGLVILKNAFKNKAWLTKTKTSVIANHSWTFYFYSRPELTVGPFEARFPPVVLWGGWMFGFLLALVVYFLGISRFQAIAIAKEMTYDLRQRTEENEGISKQLELTLADVQAQQAVAGILTERIELATQAAKMGVWDWDVVNDVILWDEQMYRIHGVKKESFFSIFETWMQILHPKDRERINLEIDMAFKGVRDFDTEFRIIWPDKTVRYIKARALVQRDDAGKALRMIGVSWDTTERRQVEQRALDQQYALDQSSIVAMTDVQGNITYVNDAFCQISQYTRGELIGQNHRLIKSDEHSSEFFRELWRTIAQGKVWKGEVKNKAKDGTFYWVDVTIIPFLNDEKKPYQYMALRFDITARKIAEANLKESQRQLMDAMEAKSKFVSIVSHELRTPMAAIQEGINLVIDGSLGEINVKQKQFLDLSKRNVERLSRLINDVLDFQKMQSNTLEMNFSRYDMNEIIRDVHGTMTSFAAKKSLVFDLDLQSDIPAIMMDRDKIVQVLTNLINNAVRNTDQGSITIASSLKDHCVHVQVRDTGIGIQAENLSRLFMSFQQLGDESRRIGGTGLGLVICKEIIEKHQGKIWVQSQWGQGSNFQFILPIG